MKKRSTMIMIGILLLFAFMMLTARPAHARLFSNLREIITNLKIDLTITKSNDDPGFHRSEHKDENGNKTGVSWTWNSGRFSAVFSINWGNSSGSKPITSDGKKKEKAEKEKAEKERLEKEKAEKERLEKEKAEKERLERERAERERLERERAERERLERERAKRERLERERAERERLERERAEKERLERERAERERLERERAEKEGLVNEESEKDDEMVYYKDKHKKYKIYRNEHEKSAQKSKGYIVTTVSDQDKSSGGGKAGDKTLPGDNEIIIGYDIKGNPVSFDQYDEKSLIYDSGGNLIPSYKVAHVYGKYKNGNIDKNYNPDTISVSSTPLDTSKLSSYKFKTLKTTYSAVKKGPTLSNEYFDLFFYNPTNGRLNLFIPNYAYFQGLVYTHGNFTAAGPLRVIGGVVALSTTPGTGKNIHLQDGAILTTDPEYLRQVFPPYTRSYRIIEWKEIPNP
ncbi:MAG: hypothetical protein J7M18_00410 [Candidatus Eremiobacteraeota bacterium]|nr:hypothetical protein [Candidatus Eremiobacteraeota bacterium]